jgi:hypothetical protein
LELAAAHQTSATTSITHATVLSRGDMLNTIKRPGRRQFQSASFVADELT